MALGFVSQSHFSLPEELPDTEIWNTFGTSLSEPNQKAAGMMLNYYERKNINELSEN